MEKNLKSFMLALTVLALTGCMAPSPRPMPIPPGEYEHKSRTIDSHGTIHEEKTSTDVHYDRYGKRIITVDKETSSDPKGLFNKSTTEKHQIIK